MVRNTLLFSNRDEAQRRIVDEAARERCMRPADAQPVGERLRDVDELAFRNQQALDRGGVLDEPAIARQ
jgi:hypothetical protein